MGQTVSPIRGQGCCGRALFEPRPEWCTRCTPQRGWIRLRAAGKGVTPVPERVSPLYPVRTHGAPATRRLLHGRPARRARKKTGGREAPCASSPFEAAATFPYVAAVPFAVFRPPWWRSWSRFSRSSPTRRWPSPPASARPGCLPRPCWSARRGPGRRYPSTPAPAPSASRRVQR